ncbi:MAG TPA: alpha-E domain-containing protein [Rhodocyclaceae bacterium]|nr:alpha-E domain-containing protein [Rhodocyclaceae bacterium]
MLSRTADHLYWMARHTERAENLARMLDVTSRMSLLQGGLTGDDAGWASALAVAGLEGAYREKHGEVTAAGVMTFLCFDTDNPSSIVGCLKSARENAHAVRGTLTSELWETINDTWLKLRETSPAVLDGSGAGEFFDWVKFRSHLSRGVTIGTMLQDEALWFARLGTYLERADSTARILDVQARRLLTGVSDVGGAGDYYQWSALLRSVSAFEVYRRVYRDRITPLRVAELFILRDDMPRSLHKCLNEVTELLEMVANRHSGETSRRAGILHAALHFGRIEDIFAKGLHEFLADFVGRIYDLSDRVANDFLIPKH